MSHGAASKRIPEPRPGEASLAHGARPTVRELASLAVVAAAFAHALAWTWMKWGDPVVDGGREMMTPARMLAGELLYVHQRNVYGPLAPYANMALYGVFGVHLSVLQVAGAVSAAAMALLLWWLARDLGDRFTAALVATAFVYVFAFGHLTPNPSFNFVVPYAYAATYGMVAATASLVCLVRHVQRGAPAMHGLAVLGLVLAAASKLEALLPAAAAHVAFLGVAAVRRKLRTSHLAAYGAGLAAIAAIYGALFARAGAALWTDNLATLANASIRSYARETMGLDAPLASLGWMAASGALLAACAGAAVGAAWLARQAPRGSPRAVGLAIASGAVAFVAYAAVSPDLPMRLLPAVAVGALAAFGWRALRDPPERADAALARAIVWAFSAGCLLRLGLHARPSHYGFFLAPVPLAALALLLLGEGPRAVARAGLAPLPARAAGAGLLAGLTLAAFAHSNARWVEHDLDVRTARGRMILRGEPWQPAVVQYLATLPPGSSVAPIPQGAGLLFLAGVPMKGSLYLYAPMEFSGAHTDEGVVRELAADPPTHVLRLEQDPGSFRYTGFGVEFGFRTAAWIGESYVPVAGSPEVTVLARGVRPSGRP